MVLDHQKYKETNKQKKVKWEGKKQQTVHFLGYLEIQISVLFEQRTLRSLDTWVSVTKNHRKVWVGRDFQVKPHAKGWDISRSGCPKTHPTWPITGNNTNK